MGKLDFRGKARECAARARWMLDGGEEQQIVYAALEIRMALEALIYEIAEGYTDDLPADRAAWQPPRLLSRLLTLDRLPDFTLELSIQAPEDQGGDWHSLGHMRRLTLQEIKANYDALGAYLHVPTMKQLAKGEIRQLTRLERRCRDLLARIEEVLTSQIPTMTFRQTSSLDCMKCGRKLTRRVMPFVGAKPHDRVIEVECFDCIASYQITWEDDGWIWAAQNTTVPCLAAPCAGELTLWEREIAFGFRAKCPVCATEHRLDALVSRHGEGEQPQIGWPTTATS